MLAFLGDFWATLFKLLELLMFSDTTVLARRTFRISMRNLRIFNQSNAASVTWLLVIRSVMKGRFEHNIFFWNIYIYEIIQCYYIANTSTITNNVTAATATAIITITSITTTATTRYLLLLLLI